MSIRPPLPPFHLSFNKDWWARHSVFATCKPHSLAVSLLQMKELRLGQFKQAAHSPTLREAEPGRSLTRVCLVPKHTHAPSFTLHCSQNQKTKSDTSLLSCCSWDTSDGGLTMCNHCCRGAKASGGKGTGRPMHRDVRKQQNPQRCRSGCLTETDREPGDSEPRTPESFVQVVYF